ncbi:isocitrate/isopropylmalate family dehydrogenase [Pasteuria penetrans]|uniref:isocitrate/isopropylmalate family dehydrogenase n=1 Tax=Pasteuria penetrans TaxID=86005 RepID=UPI000F95DA12|nr:isocitrate/isopropylmalate family dehydrogenase [Pasteuria penetrans]
MHSSIDLVVMAGDQTGQELLLEALRILDPTLLRYDIKLHHFNLSLENRKATHNQIVRDAAQAMQKTGFGLKAATITPEKSSSIGSPNALLREAIEGKVILRTGQRIPGTVPAAGAHAPISVVRMAVGDAYGAKEWRTTEDGDEIAYRTERIDRTTCHSVAEFSFQHARRVGAKVFGGPKYTVSPVYEGLLKEELDHASRRYPDVPYEPQLIDATYALLLNQGGEPLVIPALNRDGDCLSDLVLQLFGSLAGAESVLLSLDENHQPKVIMAEAPHGTAPALEGKNIANPMAMILACASILIYTNHPQAMKAAQAIRESIWETLYSGIRTADLGGNATTSSFTDEVVQLTKKKLGSEKENQS